MVNYQDLTHLKGLDSYITIGRSEEVSQTGVWLVVVVFPFCDVSGSQLYHLLLILPNTR